MTRILRPEPLYPSSRCRWLAGASHLLLIVLSFASVSHAQTGSDWYMAGANPQRTSWVSDEAAGPLTAQWVRPIEPYVSRRVQPIAVDGSVYVSTSRGLYAFDAAGGEVRWVFPTELPLGHSPTIYDGIAFVGGVDRKLRAIDTEVDLAGLPTEKGIRINNSEIWSFTAGSGFLTNPLVVDGVVYAGNRDGYFYALDAATGQKKWEFKAGGQILFSAAYQNGRVFFAASDCRAYALDSATGSLLWSTKLASLRFQSFWPVVYHNWVILTGEAARRSGIEPGQWSPFDAEKSFLYPHRDSDPPGTLVGLKGTQPGDWAPGTPTIDISRSNSIGSSVPVTEYFEQFPYRRYVFVLEQATGDEVEFDLDSDGKTDWAPFLYTWTNGGVVHPPVVGYDDVLYKANNYFSDDGIADGGIAGWMPGLPFLSLPQSQESGHSGAFPVDEPLGYSAGGTYIYWNRWGGGGGTGKPSEPPIGGFDLSRPNVKFPVSDPLRQWRYTNWALPGYDSQMAQYQWDMVNAGGTFHTTGPVPHKGMLFAIKNNALVALAPAGEGLLLPIAPALEAVHPADPVPKVVVQERLTIEVQKMLAAGHLRPGFGHHGLFDHRSAMLADSPMDYWHNPSDTILSLIRALPHLPATLQAETKVYLKNEFNSYPPIQYGHMGWKTGASREGLILPPETEADMAAFGPGAVKTHPSFAGWHVLPPLNFYAIWKYAVLFQNDPAVDPSSLFGAVQGKLEQPPEDSYLLWNPHVHNAYIAGYLGYVELGKLAGLEEKDLQPQQTELQRLLTLRAETFQADLIPQHENPLANLYFSVLKTAWNFMDLVPELGDYLHEEIPQKLESVVDQYTHMAPYWMVGHNEDSQREGAISPLHQRHSLFQAKALLLKQPADELSKFLDAPAVSVGDLYYIDNLVSILEGAASIPGTGLDVDGDGISDSLTDGLLILRYSFGFRGTALTQNAVAPLCSRCSAPEIEDYLASIYTSLDIDGNGSTDALTDALLVIQYLFGFRGDALIDGALSQDCTRCDAASIEAYLAYLLSGAPR